MVLGLTNEITMFIKKKYHTEQTDTELVFGLTNQIMMFIKTNITLHRLIQIWC
jgi:hypothetical protein